MEGLGDGKRQVRVKLGQLQIYFKAENLGWKGRAEKSLNPTNLLRDRREWRCRRRRRRSWRCCIESRREGVVTEVDASDGAPLEDHIVLGQRASLITE